MMLFHFPLLYIMTLSILHVNNKNHKVPVLFVNPQAPSCVIIGLH